MAHTSLTSLFSDIADAIRAKTGGSAAIVADDFPTAIAAIPTGGGGGPVLPDPSTVTDLSGTTWLLNDTIDVTGIPNSNISPYSYKVLFSVAKTNTSVKYTSPMGDYMFQPPFVLVARLCRHPNWPQLRGKSFGAWNDYSIGKLELSGDVVIYDADSGWTTTYNPYKIWKFSASALESSETSDHTNATLITWMKNNATLINIG